jgi:hypothetical protein
MRPVLIPRCDVVGKPLKKPTTDQAAPGLEPGTSRMQSGALGAWPQCWVVNSGRMSIFYIRVDWRRFDDDWCPLDDVA